jgi:hypothetical protein
VVLAAATKRSPSVVARSRQAWRTYPKPCCCSYGPIMNQTKAAATPYFGLRDAELRVPRHPTTRPRQPTASGGRELHRGRGRLNASGCDLSDYICAADRDRFIASHPRRLGARAGRGARNTARVQLEPGVMAQRRAASIAERIMACADVAYLQGQVVLRSLLGGCGVGLACYDDIPPRGPGRCARTPRGAVTMTARRRIRRPRDAEKVKSARQNTP